MYIINNLSSLKILETHFKIADIASQAVVLSFKPLYTHTCKR